MSKVNPTTLETARENEHVAYKTSNEFLTEISQAKRVEQCRQNSEETSKQKCNQGILYQAFFFFLNKMKS